MNKDIAVTLFMQAFFGAAETPHHRALVEESSRFVKAGKSNFSSMRETKGQNSTFSRAGR